MLIDWFTVVAQIVNFLVLVWLMRRFLYGPILAAIDAREARIAAEIADAERRQAEATSEREAFERKNAEFDEQRDDMVRAASAAAETERGRLITEARITVERERTKQKDAWRQQAESLNQALRRRTQQEVFAIARQALADLASTSLEERLSAVFTRRLKEMDGPARARLAEGLGSASDPVVVRSAYDLPDVQREAIQHALNHVGGADVGIRFDTNPDLVSGIELTTNGQKVAWSISEYLASLEKAVEEHADAGHA